MNESNPEASTSSSHPEPLHSSLNNGLDLSNKSCKKTSDVNKEKTPEPAKETDSPKKGASTSNSTGKTRKRKKCLKDAKAPKQPLTGYFRFLNDRREKVRTENPTMPFSEITKHLAAEWNVLPADQKQQYLDAAEQDKERYNREMNDYKQTEAYRLFQEKQANEEQNEKKEKNETDIPNTAASSSTATTSTEKKESRKDKNNENGIIDIPIFTEEFLEHNKTCEAELRQLRKSMTDYESQNAVLQRHVESLQVAVSRLETDTNNKAEANQTLQRYLDNLRSQLASSFSNIPLTDSYPGATLQNIDFYLEKVDSLASGNMDAALRGTFRTAVSRLDFIK